MDADTIKSTPDNYQGWQRRAATFLASQGLSLFGSMLVQYAIIWHITLTTQSGAILTVATIAGFLPQIAISIFAGVWADRYPRKPLIILSDSLTAASTLVLALLFLAGYQQIWLLIAVSAVRAVGAGIQPALIHHYFADKHGLYEAVIRRAADQMSTASWRVLETAKGVEDIVRGFIDVMVDFSMAHQKLLAIMRSEVLSGAGVLVEIVREKTHTLLEAVVDIVKNLQGAGELRDDVEPREMVRAGLSLVLYPIVDAPVLEMLLPEDARADSTNERRKRVIADLLLSGIRKLR